jgi:hypothetical protein
MTGGTFALVVPVLLSVRAMVRHQELSNAALWWVTGDVPPATIIVAFGALVFCLSMFLYLDAKRRENV